MAAIELAMVAHERISRDVIWSRSSLKMYVRDDRDAGKVAGDA
jgi:hypothetical protein